MHCVASLLKQSRLERIITNGNKAYEVYMKYIYPVVKTEAVRLPSTSPANAAWSLEKLTQAWKEYIVIS